MVAARSFVEHILERLKRSPATGLQLSSTSRNRRTGPAPGLVVAHPLATGVGMAQPHPECRAVSSGRARYRWQILEVAQAQSSALYSAGPRQRAPAR